MALDAGNIQASLSLNLTNFLAGMKQATASVKAAGTQFSNAFGSATQGHINNTTKAINKANIGMKDMQRVVSGIILSQVFYRSAQAIGQATDSIIDFTSNMKTAQISMGYFLGSSDRAENFLGIMKDFAAVTPFTTEQTLGLSRRLMAMGFMAETVKSTMTIMTDAAAATGGTPEQMDRIVLALGQMKTNGYVAGQELRQLAEAGIPAYRMLSEELGLTADQMKNIGDQKISGEVGVTAVLTGLEKRYKGAAAKIAELLPGMWSTIKDDALMISEKVFAGPYKALEDWTRNLRNGMEKARQVLKTGNLGALFNAFVPKELQAPLRTIISAVRSLAESFKILWAAMGPVLADLGKVLISVLATVLPVLAAMARAVSRLAEAALNSSPIVRFLSTAILSLMVANTATTALVFLWRAVSTGAIAAAVARAVDALSIAIRILYVVMTANPVVAVITLISGALLYLALSSKTASAWIGQMMSKLAALTGMSASLTPEVETTNWADFRAIDDFNDSLTSTQDKLKKAGDAGAKAGKKIKDKFVAGFDELYQIPDALDAASGAAGDIGDAYAGLGDLGSLFGGIPSAITDPLDTGTTAPAPFKWTPPANATPPPPTSPSAGPPTQPPTPQVQEQEVKGWQTLKNAITLTIATYEIFKNVMKEAWETSKENLGKIGDKFTDWGKSISLVVSAAGIAIALLPVVLWKGVLSAAERVHAGWQTIKDKFSSMNKSISLGIGVIAVTLAALPGVMWNACVEAAGRLLEGLQNFGDTLAKYKEPLLIALAILGGAILLFFTGIPASLGVAAAALIGFFGTTFLNAKNASAAELDKTKVVIGTKWDAIKAATTTKLNDIGTYMQTKWVNIRTSVSNIWSSFGGLANKAWTGIKTSVKAALNGIRLIINKFIDFMNTLKITVPAVNIPLVGKTGGFSIGLPNIPRIPELATGGIVTKDQIVRVAEKGRPEAVVPLSGDAARPFAAMIAAEIARAGGNQQSQQDTRPIFYVGTMIADERSLKALERKMQIIRTGEKQRKGGSF